MPTDTDSGIYIYDGSESASPYKTMLNLLANSVKNAIIALKAMFTDTAQGASNWAFNSCFDINQRGGTSWTAVGWTVDRWYLYSRVATTVNWITLGATETFFKTIKCIELLATATTNSATYVQAYAAEDVAEMRGQAVKFEVPMLGLNAASQATISIQKSPTANSVSATNWTVINSVNVTPGTAGTKAIVYATIPADTTAAGVRVVVSTNNNPNGYGVRIGRITFAPGTTPPSQHRRRGFTAKGDERECMAYYVRLTTGGAQYVLFGHGFADGSTSAQIGIQLPVKMRTQANPTAESGGTFSLMGGGASAVTSFAQISASFIGDAFVCVYPLSSGLSTNSVYALRSTSVNAFLAFSAEL